MRLELGDDVLELPLLVVWAVIAQGVGLVGLADGDGAG